MIKNENMIQTFQVYPGIGEPIGLLSIPHSGEHIPDEFKNYLSEKQWDLMQDVDYKVHELIDIKKLQAAGVTIIKSDIIRTAVDLNRKIELSLLNWKQNSKGKKLVIQEPDKRTSEELLAKYYLPYYEVLKTHYFMMKERSNLPSFIDLHSMPGKAEEYHLKINPNQDIIRPDFCLSDVNGKTCSPEFISFVKDELSKNFENVTINSPYFGGQVTRHMNQLYSPLNNIQIEISRTLYMNEENKELYSEGVLKLKKYLTEALISTFITFYNRFKI